MKGRRSMTVPGKWLLISDVDGTLTTEPSIWETFHRQLGKWESEGLPNLQAYLSGSIDYTEFAARDAMAYKDLSRDALHKMAAAIPRRTGMERMLERLSKRCFSIALVSTGLDILLDQIPHADIRIANRLLFDNNRCTGRAEVVIPIDGKGQAVESLMKKMGVSPDHTVVLGDSTGDIAMMRQAGFSIAVAAEPAVRQVATASIDGSDLMRLPALVMEYRERVDLRRSAHRR